MNLGTPEILILLFVVVLIFGSAKLPQLARSLGKSARILKAETKGLVEDDDDKPQQAAPAPAAAPSEDARDRAARLREEAARLEREAAAGERRPGALPSGEPIEGVPVDRGQYRANG
ncbi:twin-arginine translocase TatA/TatE family subunit [Actinomadura rupiterrae]|uniref:twin-arginine translocase TatA/TatE family subunit n=1 Tax=Actinomadura rupiterrae TaxID=559627 RepID=UPI0020A4852E|nr:twin-arginine translocase TatA/TatE family subunit [Actinomadura rupiterrae]MCP2342605.1 sec-independent protein translocase protein TatA [Actinomadura rupiterrae]